MLLARDVSIFQDIYCLSDTPLERIFDILLENDCGCVTIVESMAHKNPIGSVSEHDICLKTIRGGLNPQRLTAARVMNGHIITVRGDASLEDCARLMNKTACDRLFVVDDNGAYCGILTDKNLVSAEEREPVKPAADSFNVCPVLARELHLAY
jgi:CBS domain-containing protein